MARLEARDLRAELNEDRSIEASFALEAGEALQVAGPSGAGKTTLQTQPVDDPRARQVQEAGAGLERVVHVDVGVRGLREEVAQQGFLVLGALDPLAPGIVERLLGDGATTLVNLLEVAGVLSHHLNPRQLHELVAHFPRRFGVRVFPTLEVEASLPGVVMATLLDLMARRLSFGDALVLHQVEQHALPDSRFVTWDAAHFTRVPSCTKSAMP